MFNYISMVEDNITWNIVSLLLSLEWSSSAGSCTMHWNHTSAIQRGNVVLTHSANWPDYFCHLQALQTNSTRILFRVTHIHELLLALVWAVLPQLTKFRGPRMHSPALHHDRSKELLLKPATLIDLKPNSNNKCMYLGMKSKQASQFSV